MAHALRYLTTEQCDCKNKDPDVLEESDLVTLEKFCKLQKYYNSYCKCFDN